MGQYMCLHSKKLNIRGKNADFFFSFSNEMYQSTKIIA